MAEYIDRNKLKKKKKYLFQTKGMPFPKSEYFIKMDDIFYMYPADVVEREKIDKAIEEIRSYKHGNGNMFWCGMMKAIEILKINIGE